MRIIVVEDDAGVRATIVRILEFLGHSVTEAANGDEAERLPSGEPFDAVFADFRLPGASGDRVVAKLRERWPHLAAVIMTGDAGRPEVRAGALDGRWRLLPKPFDFEQVADQLRHLAGAREPSGAP